MNKHSNFKRYFDSLLPVVSCLLLGTCKRATGEFPREVDARKMYFRLKEGNVLAW